MVTFNNNTSIQLDQKLIQELKTDIATHTNRVIIFKIIDLNPKIGSDLGALDTSNINSPINEKVSSTK